MGYPGIDKTKTRLVYRTIGGPPAGERLGMGIMHKPGVRTDEENLEFPAYVLVYVIRGRGDYVDASGIHHSLRPGSIFQRLPGMKHSTYIEPDSRWAECFIELSPTLYEALVTMGIVRAGEIVYGNPPDPLFEATVYDFLNELEECSELELPPVCVRIFSYVADILRSNQKVSDKDPSSRMVEMGVIYLAQQCRKRPDLRQFCESHGWGYESFRKAFRARVGISPGRYLVRRRMDLACSLLRASDEQTAGIARKLGYSSPYEFSAQFKREIGMSPRQFRGGGQLQDKDE